MTADIIKSSIIQMQDELNYLTAQDKSLTSQYILKLSTKLDELIVQYLKMTA